MLENTNAMVVFTCKKIYLAPYIYINKVFVSYKLKEVEALSERIEMAKSESFIS